MSQAQKTPKATTVAIYSLGALLGFVHVFLAVVALTPIISNDYHREIKINYSAFAKSLLNLYDFGERITVAYYLRLIISSVEAILGLLLIENGYFGGSLDKIGNFGLIALDVTLLAFQLSVGSPYERLAPTVVFLILLTARLIIIEQSQRRSRPGVKTRNAGKPKTSTPKKNKNE